MIISTAAASSDLLEGIYKLPYAEIIAIWGIGFLILYGIFVVFTGDLVSGHTLNTGQMSSDFHYLSTLPVSPTILIFIKLFERLITDYFGILFLLPALIGISCYKAYTLNAFLAAILLFFEISILIGLLINLVNICLTRFFKLSTINNIYSIFGYISAILAFIPFLIFSDFNPNHAKIVVEKIIYLQENFGWLMQPIKWMATPIFHSTPFCVEFGYITLLWLILAVFFTFLFHIAVKNNWFSYVHSSKSVASKTNNRRLFSGLLWKEWLMVKSDLNLLVNAILMPISVIAIEIYFLKRVFSFTSMFTVMNFIWGSIIYFSLFGPINIIGYEGKAISFLESLPITPSKLISKKYCFWAMLALSIFVPATIITFKVIDFDWYVTGKAAILTTLFTLASVWVTVCLSAIFANYETVVLQQHSSFIGKMVAMFLMSLLLPVKSLSLLNFYSLIIFATITYLCYLKAQSYIAFRNDKEAMLSENHQIINCCLLFLSFLAIQISIKQFFFSLVPDTDTGIWPWCLSLGAMFLFFILAKKKDSPFFPKLPINSTCKQEKDSLSKPSSQTIIRWRDNPLFYIFKIFIISLTSLIITYGYFWINPNSLKILKTDILQIIDFFSIISIVKPIWTAIVFFLLTIFMISAVRRIEEYFFTKSCNKLINLLGITLLVLVATKNLMFPVFVFVSIMQILKDKENRFATVFYSSILYFSILFAYLIF